VKARDVPPDENYRQLPVTAVFLSKVVLSLRFLLGTYPFVQESLTWLFLLPFQDITWGKLQVNSVLCYNLPVINVDSLSNVQKWTTALIIWLKGLTSSKAVCWYRTKITRSIRGLEAERVSWERRGEKPLRKSVAISVCNFCS